MIHKPKLCKQTKTPVHKNINRNNEGSKPMQKIKNTLGSFVQSLRSSKRAILLITITAVVTLIASSLIFIWISRVTNLKVPSMGIIKTLGVEAYWDENLTDKIDEDERIDWGTLWIGSSNNITIYLRSISNTEATLYVNPTNWNPANLSKYMNLSCPRNGTTVHPDEKIQTTLTLSAPYSYNFILYLIANDVKEFSIDIHITTSEYSS